MKREYHMERNKNTICKHEYNIKLNYESYAAETLISYVTAKWKSYIT